MPAKSEMTPRQAAWVREFRVDRNATKAAVRAGFSERSARQQGARMLTYAAVKAALAEQEKVVTADTEITHAKVLQGLGRIGFSDIRRIFDANGNLLRIHELDDETAAAVSSVKVVVRKVAGGDRDEVEHVAEIKLADKRAALVDIGKHLGMFREQVDVNVNLRAWLIESFEAPGDGAKRIEGK